MTNDDDDDTQFANTAKQNYRLLETYPARPFSITSNR